MSLSDYRDGDDARSLDMYNVSQVKPVRKTGYYDFPCAHAAYKGDPKEGQTHYHTDEASRVRCAERAVEIAAEPEPYSDEALDADEKDGLPGSRHAAKYLRTLDTPARRKRAVSEAWTLGNIIGGIYSNNVAKAVSELSRNIANGNESAELYGEKFARVAREREAELRATTGNPNAIYYPAFPGR